MKLAIYDPLYSNIGHFHRYNRYLAELAARVTGVREVLYLSGTSDGFTTDAAGTISACSLVSDPGNVQTRLTGARSAAAKITLHLNLVSAYFSVLREIARKKPDLLVFSSNGTSPFWLAVNCYWKRPYAVSVISVRWLHEGGWKHGLLKWMFTQFLRRASFVLTTEEYYRPLLAGVNPNTFVLPERALSSPDACARAAGDAGNRLVMVTLGTISDDKNPLNFVRMLLEAGLANDPGMEYRITGKAFGSAGETLATLVHNQQSISFRDSYISPEEYHAALATADIVVIPYDAEYTKYMTSGVMWDCFSARVPILCPDLPLFRYYIDKYGIGLLYGKDNLRETILRFRVERDLFTRSCFEGYARMSEDMGFESNLHRLQHAMTESGVDCGPKTPSSNKG